MDNIKYKKKYHKYKNKYYKLIQKQPLKGGSQSMSVIAVVLTVAALLSLITGAYMNSQTIKDFFDKNFEIIKKRVENLLRSRQIAENKEKKESEEHEKKMEKLQEGIAGLKTNKVEDKTKAEEEMEAKYEEAKKNTEEAKQKAEEMAKQKAKQAEETFLIFKKEYMTLKHKNNIKEELEFIFNNFEELKDEMKKNLLDGVKNIKLKPDEITGKNVLHWTFKTRHFYVSEDSINGDPILIKYYPEFGDHTDISVYDLKNASNNETASFKLRENNLIKFGNYELEYTPPETTLPSPAPAPAPAELAEAIRLLEAMRATNVTLEKKTSLVNVAIDKTRQAQKLVEKPVATTRAPAAPEPAPPTEETSTAAEAETELTKAKETAEKAQTEANEAVEAMGVTNVTLEEKAQLVKVAIEKILKAEELVAKAEELAAKAATLGAPPPPPVLRDLPTVAEAAQSSIQLPDFLNNDEKKGILSELDINPKLGQSFGYYKYNNTLIPIKFLGKYTENNEHTDTKIFTPNNKNALVLYSANETNAGEWSEERIKAGGRGQAIVNTMGNKNTYGIYAGKLNDNSVDVVDAYESIANSINSAMKYFLESREYDYIVHPRQVSSTGYYSGLWEGRLKIEKQLPSFKTFGEDDKIRLNNPRFLTDSNQQSDNIFIEKNPDIIPEVNSCKKASDALDSMITTYFTEMNVSDVQSKKKKNITQEELDNFKTNLRNIINKFDINGSIKNIKDKIMPGEGQCQQDVEEGLITTLEYLNMEDKFKIKKTETRTCIMDGNNKGGLNEETHFTPLNNYIVVHNVIFIKEDGEDRATKLDLTGKIGMIRKNIKYDNNTEYELIGLIYHQGSIDAGHYIGYIKRNNTWWYCNNDTIIKTKLSDETTDEEWKKCINKDFPGVDPVPYLMFYKEVNVTQTDTYKPNKLVAGGNSCWLNVLLQNLFNIDEIRNYILSD